MPLLTRQTVAAGNCGNDLGGSPSILWDQSLSALGVRVGGAGTRWRSAPVPSRASAGLGRTLTLSDDGIMMGL
jgi:hypothetical protein